MYIYIYIYIYMYVCMYIRSSSRGRARRGSHICKEQGCKVAKWPGHTSARTRARAALPPRIEEAAEQW